MFNVVGLFLFTVPGVQSPAPFVGATRQVVLNLDPTRLYAKGVSPQDAEHAGILQRDSAGDRQVRQLRVR